MIIEPLPLAVIDCHHRTQRKKKSVQGGF